MKQVNTSPLICAHLPEIVAATRSSNRWVLAAPPGAGKTTRVPLTVADVVAGTVVVTQPRRLAARLAAQHVAAERGERVGGYVGYRVRFDERVSSQTRVLYVTEGVLLRRLLSDPQLVGVGAVLVDEVHERHVETDVLLCLLRRTQERVRADLRLGVMSATLDIEALADWLDGAPMLRVPGRAHPVVIEHLHRPDTRPLEQQVAAAVHRWWHLAPDDPGAGGDALVFLPGAAEIARAARALDDFARTHDLLVAPLHGSLAPAAQDLAVRPGTRRKVVLATNVAETSVTIDGLSMVIDSGLARVAGFAPWSGVKTLDVRPISQASAAQRAGRAGRTRPGRALRLYTAYDHSMRPRFDVPHILRSDLTETALLLHGAGIADARALPWLDAPTDAAWQAADALLRDLGALASDGTLTEIGRRMQSLPLPPRLARVWVEAARRGAGRRAAPLVALLAEGGIERRTHLDGPHAASATGPSDALAMLERFEAAQASERRRDDREGLGLDARTVDVVARVAREIERYLEPGETSGSGDDTSLLAALLAGFPDRVARRRTRGSSELLLCTGGRSARQSPASVVHNDDLVVVLDAERQGGGTNDVLVARMLSRIEEDWLLDMVPERLREETSVVWDEQGQRVRVRTTLRYGELVLDEREREPRDPERTAAAQCLAAAVARVEFAQLVDRASWLELRGRLAVLRTQRPDLGIPGDAALQAAAIAAACARANALAEVGPQLMTALRDAIPETVRRELDRIAPREVTIIGGRKLPVHYELDRPPWVESYLQDFFGMTDGPTVGGGKLPVVLHLLAPNRRAVQITQDLRGFWANHYPAVRKELVRRYPRHNWPEDPTKPGKLLRSGRR